MAIGVDSRLGHLDNPHLLCYTHCMATKEKTGIYCEKGSKGNLINLVNNEVVVSPEVREEIESELWRYIREPKRSPSEYLFSGSQNNIKDTDTLELSPEELKEIWDESSESETEAG